MSLKLIKPSSEMFLVPEPDLDLVDEATNVLTGVSTFVGNCSCAGHPVAPRTRLRSRNTLQFSRHADGSPPGCGVLVEFEPRFPSL
jgi:hypothetical protein